MSTYILTSYFPDGLEGEPARIFDRLLPCRSRFAFVASDFEKDHETTDFFADELRGLFSGVGIYFEHYYVIDGRMTPEEAQQAAREADILWLAGGDTLAQFASLEEYGLIGIIRQHPGVVIGMSAGTINLAVTAVLYDPEYGVHTAEVYRGIGCVDISADPHFEPERVPATLLNVSEEHVIYGLCDGAIIVLQDGQTEFYGEVYRLSGGDVERIS